MSKHRFKLLLPKPDTCGNLLWSYPINEEEENELQALFQKIKAIGFWCSCFPEKDGFCFTPDDTGQIKAPMLTMEYYNRTVTLFKEVFGEALFVNELFHNN